MDFYTCIQFFIYAIIWFSTDHLEAFIIILLVLSSINNYIYNTRLQNQIRKQEDNRKYIVDKLQNQLQHQIRKQIRKQEDNEIRMDNLKNIIELYELEKRRNTKIDDTSNQLENTTIISTDKLEHLVLTSFEIGPLLVSVSTPNEISTKIMETFLEEKCCARVWAGSYNRVLQCNNAKKNNDFCSAHAKYRAHSGCKPLPDPMMTKQWQKFGKYNDPVTWTIPCTSERCKNEYNRETSNPNGICHECLHQ